MHSGPLWYYFVMKPLKVGPTDMRSMIADYMEKGYLENIIDMFKHDENMYSYVGDLIKDERLIVRIGVSALLDTLKEEDPEHISKAISSVSPLIKDENPVVRSDAAYFLGMIGDRDVLSFLTEMANDENESVRVIAKEAIEEIEAKPPN
jgi:HEAT repeat protein